MNLKEKLILKKLEKVYCKLAPSPIHGVGIFAIREIPKGTNPFADSFMAQESMLIPKNKIKSQELLSMLNDYHPTSDPKQQIVSNYPNQLIWTNYINYSDDPNIELLPNGEWSTLTDIKIGDELLEDPKRLLNKDGSQKIFTVSHRQYPLLNYT
jgi:SET domain-containing protein